ncbi:MAG: lysine--tRNA ligase [Candidatus Hadarchaeota archaeon]
MHWIDGVAEELMKRGGKQVIASGISISGHIHIGHANDVFIADAVRRSLEARGAEAEAIWYADDYDPMRRIPWPLNEGELAENYKKYLGFPYANIPSPSPEFKSFVDFFQRPFVESLHDYGIRVKIHSGAEIYRSGRMAGMIRTALEHAGEIREILNRFREKPLPEDWLPFDAICSHCGRIATTKAISWEGNQVRYRCEGTDYAAGCDHECDADYTRGEGKLTWRVEWPARWKLLGVSCEPFGKDHAVVGGSYDTGKPISRNIFGYEPPVPLPYEWVSMKGKKLSSSKGVVFTLKQWLEVAEPELLRYFIFRSKPMKSKEFDPGVSLPDLYEEYDIAEQVHFKKLEVPASREGQLSRIYELSQVREVPEAAPQRVSFRFAAVLCQVAREEAEAVEILTKRKVLESPARSDIDLAMKRIELARNWVDNYAPDHLKFTLLEGMKAEVRQQLAPGQKDGLKRLAQDLKKKDFTPIELHNHIYEVAKQTGVEAVEVFKAIYLVLLGRESGPRAGAFISALEKGFVVKRLMEAAAV